MKTKNKVFPILLIFSCTISLIGCGSTANPAVGEDVVESTEEMVGNSTETTVESSDEATSKTESKDGAVAGADKPAEPSTTSTAGPRPESTAEPTASPAEKPQATATPEPTAPPHVHEYVESITVHPTCAEAGVKTLTCSCGDSKTEAIPATGNHNWVTQYTQIEHEALGHVETTEQQVQVGTTRRTEYECAKCGARFDTAAGVVEHCKSYIPEGDKDHAGARTIAWDYDEPVYEMQTISEWVIDSSAWTENVPCGETCSVCGATKQLVYSVNKKDCLAL